MLGNGFALFAGARQHHFVINKIGTISLPEQMVGAEGYINVPFAGRIKVAGKNLQRIETDIVKA